ncbi:hypothetical protein ACROYT_G038427 [Oculina patagonica]
MTPFSYLESSSLLRRLEETAGQRERRPWVRGCHSPNIRVLRFDFCTTMASSVEEKGCLSPYRKLLVDLSFGLSSKEVEMLNLAGVDFIPRGTREKISTGLHFFDVLEQDGRIGPRNLSLLQDLLETIGRVDLSQKIQAFLTASVDNKADGESAAVLVERLEITDTKDTTDKHKLVTGRGLVQSNSPGSVVPTINQTTIGVNPDKGETQSTENEDWKLLNSAIQGGNVAIIEMVLSRGLDINSKDSYGDTPLMIAARGGKMEAVNYLLDKGADLSLTGQYGRNSLHNASYGGNVAIIETVLSRGLDVNSKDSDSDTPIMIAALCGKMEAVNYLLDKGANLSLTGKFGRNLLHHASDGGNVAIIETMLSRGLDVNSKDSNSDTPIMIAAFCGKMEAVNYLLDKGADLSLTGQYGRNLLHKASVGGNVAIIETMLSRGLDVNSKDNNGDTPLTIAAARGHAEAVNYLLSRGAR